MSTPPFTAPFCLTDSFCCPQRAFCTYARKRKCIHMPLLHSISFVFVSQPLSRCAGLRTLASARPLTQPTARSRTQLDSGRGSYSAGWLISSFCFTFHTLCNQSTYVVRYQLLTHAAFVTNTRKTLMHFCALHSFHTTKRKKNDNTYTRLSAPWTSESMFPEALLTASGLRDFHHLLQVHENFRRQTRFIVCASKS